MTYDEDAPWLTPGNPVAVVRGRWNYKTFTLDEVERRTRTLVILKSGKKFKIPSISGGKVEEQGVRLTMADVRAYLTDPESAEVKEMAREAAIQSARHRLIATAEATRNDHSPEAAASALEASREYERLVRPDAKG